MRIGARSRAVLAVVVAGVGFGLGRASARAQDPPLTVTGLFGVGGIIAARGDEAVLWQYMPNQKKWMTIDEAFKRDGRDTKILPLPVKAQEIRSMESWGFLVTTSGKLWQYDLETNRWVDIGTP
jgi:hypothetical protein